MSGTTDEQGQRLRMELMTVQIDKGRLDIQRVMQEIRTDNRKFLVQALLAAAAILGAGVAIGRFVVFHA